MRSKINISTLGFILIGLVMLQVSCSEGDMADTGGWKTGLYFQKDSITYSFGVTPLSVTEYTLSVPLKVMGNFSTSARSFVLKIDEGKTTATKSVHFDIADSFTVDADSINAYVDLIIHRDKLENDENLRVAFDLVENENFVPVNENFKSAVIYFNNRVDPPDWKDFAGNPTWPDFKLGAWNPLTYIKFIELFREMENIVPGTYYNMVAEFGEDLKNVEFGWALDYDQSLTKYVLIPLYRYFMVDHPELGVVIPMPAGFTN